MMIYDSPIRNRFEDRPRSPAAAPTAPVDPARAQGERVAHPEPLYLPYGPGEERTCEIVATWGEIELEYAAFRAGAAIMDEPRRGVLLLRGTDRRAFLHRLLTQDLRALEPGRAAHAFLLNRKGRIIADTVVAEAGDAITLITDVHQCDEVARELETYKFGEDVVIESPARAVHVLSMHGPFAAEAIDALADVKANLNVPSSCTSIILAGAPVTIIRTDGAGVWGAEIVVARGDAVGVWESLTQVELPSAPRRRVRPAGWFAFNTARIETGGPIFNVDFGVTNLPHESGVLAERVSFRKGCYVGQEVVARMESLGKPKQVIVGLRVESDALPAAGSTVCVDAPGAAQTMDPVGVVTSSTISPMLGRAPIALAMIRTAHAEVGKTLSIEAEGQFVGATVTPLPIFGAPKAEVNA